MLIKIPNKYKRKNGINGLKNRFDIITSKTYNHRYDLKKGKFGYYFYDNEVMVDMSLEMVMNRLNRNESNKGKQQNIIDNQKEAIFKLRGKIIMLREVNKID